MIDVNLDFSGLQDIARDLQTLSKAENNKVLRESTRAGAELLRQEVIDLSLIHISEPTRP